MDTTRIDAVARLFDNGFTRREALRYLVAGAASLTASGTLLAGEDAAAGKKRRKRKSKRNSQREMNADVCEGRNWCVDRTQTCGPEGGYGKCLVTAKGKNICAEILFQVASCEECGPANCTDCRCVPAVGGDDRCNNGANGYDFICVRDV